MGLSFIITGEDRAFLAVVIYSFPPNLSDEAIAANMNSIFVSEYYLGCEFKRTNLVWSFPESTLVPAEFYQDELKGEMLDMVYGNVNGGILKTDFMFGSNQHNIYRLPEKVQNSIPDKLRYAHQTHQHSLVSGLPGKTGNQLLAIFYHHHVTLVLSRSGKLLIVKDFEYADPDTAAYHALNIVAGFDMRVNDVQLDLCGMIDADSNLYTALYKYFININWFNLPSDTVCTDEIRKYPAHFFSHLYAQSQCV